ncbi:MAG: hypothetical protein V4538_14975 [Bacteroidota bacterium]
MNPELKSYIISFNCKIINEVKKSLTNNEVVGWLIKSTSLPRKDYHLEKINKFIKENKLDYYISDYSGIEFFIYKP